MAAFSSPFQQHHPFLQVDSAAAFLPNTTPSTIINNIKMWEQENLHNNTNLSAPTNNEASVDPTIITNKNSVDSSSIVTDKYDCTQKVTSPIDKKRKFKETSSAQSKDKREVKGGKKQKKMKDGEEKKKGKEGEEAPTGYIHVRARRGQATDSHSLAERVRRERISERMKLLQALVPGCDKVTGKALMLDEIINYVQSLQNQVEFLSMKLASMNSMFYDFGTDLESIMVRPEQDISILPSQLQSMQECSPTTANNYNLLENSTNYSILFQQAQIPNVIPQFQGSRQGLWEVDEHRQKLTNQSGFSNNLFSFH